MGKYIIKRLIDMFPIILGVTFIVFLIMALTPGDPGRLILGMNAKQNDVDALNHELGLDKPFLVRYVDYVKNCIKGDFGFSYRSRRPVFEEIYANFHYTVILAVCGTIFSYLIGLPLGILSAVKQYSFIDISVTVMAMIFASIPDFWLALMMILLFSLRLGWLPPSGVDSVLSFIMPIIVISLPSAAITSRLTRTTMLECIRQDYVRTARAKGVPDKVVIWKHAFMNAMLPLLVIMITSFGLSLGGTVLIETVFSIPGIGYLVIDSIRQKDIPVVMASTIFLGVIYSFFVLIADLVIAYIDPRVKSVYLKKSRV